MDASFSIHDGGRSKITNKETFTINTKTSQIKCDIRIRQIFYFVGDEPINISF